MPVLESPVFSNAPYSSGVEPTQISDAIQRAQYFDHMKPDWHTLLGGEAAPAYTMHVRQAAGCPTGPFFAGCNYVFALNPDGTCCRFILMQINAFLTAWLAVRTAGFRRSSPPDDQVFPSPPPFKSGRGSRNWM